MSKFQFLRNTRIADLLIHTTRYIERLRVPGCEDYVKLIVEEGRQEFVFTDIVGWSGCGVTPTIEIYIEVIELTK